MPFLRTTILPETGPVADGTIAFDLPVNPLSVVFLCIRPLNSTGSLADFQRMMGLAGALDKIRILHKGSPVYAMSGRDALAFNYYRHGMLPINANGDDTNNERNCMVLPVILGRGAYDRDSCFPATVRGQLQMEIEVDIADTGYSGLRISVETLELLEARPSHFERKVTIARTFPVVGQNDTPLPTGRLIRGLLLFGTTAFFGPTPAPSWGRISLLLDNQHVGLNGIDWESLQNDGQLMGRDINPLAEYHAHRVNAGSASATEQTLDPVTMDALKNGFLNYAYIELDPWRDDSEAIDTTNSANWLIRADAETADAVRVIQVERINV